MTNDDEIGEGTSRVPNAGVAKQIAVTFVISIASMNGGLIQGWNSPMEEKLRDPDSPVGPMTDDEISLMASMDKYCAFPALLMLAFIANNFGRKPTLLMTGVGSTVCSSILYLAMNKPMLYVGKGLGAIPTLGGVFGAMYLSEVIHESIRGTLVSTYAFVLNIGVLIAYWSGALLSYKVFNGIITLFPLIFTLLVFWLPESPHYLISKSRTKDAKVALTWLRGGDRQTAKLELETIKPSTNVEKMTFTQVIKTRATRQALIISGIAFGLQSLSGIHAILNYCSRIFKEAGSPISANNSANLVAALNTAAAVVSVILVDRLGRKPLMLISFIGNTITMGTLSLYLYLQMTGTDVSHFGWIPVSCVSIFALTYGVGLAGVPTIITNELSPVSTKPVVTSVVLFIALYLALAVVQSFSYLKNHIGLYSTFLIPAVFNILGLFFTIFMMPETKGKTIQEISDMLNGVSSKL